MGGGRKELQVKAWRKGDVGKEEGWKEGKMSRRRDEEGRRKALVH